jgi:broad specificity phosphatase PhoE
LYSASVPRAAHLLVGFLLAFAPPHIAGAQEAIYVVRHAERLDQSTDSPLSTAGVGRAYKLRDLLRSGGITHVFTTERQRTIATAKPLADALKLTPQVVPGVDVRPLLDRLAALKPQDRVLVVGHSNTLPDLLRALGVATPVTIGDDEFDKLFIVVPRKESAALLLRLTY